VRIVISLGLTTHAWRYRLPWLAALVGVSALADTVFTVDTADREQVRLFHQLVYAASEGAQAEWTGSVDPPVPGTTATAYQEAVRLRINYYRALAGLPAWAELDPVFSAKAQQAALMMSVQGALSHNPTPDWTYYTADGAEAAANSNLALGSHGPDSITGYMEDYGAGNAAVGHRRWLLFPRLRTFGTGDVPTTSGKWAANATWVFGWEWSDPLPPTRDSFVAWPPPGHVPADQVFARWSFAHAGADFANAQVRMYRAAEEIPLTIASRAANLGDPAIVWVPAGLDPNAFPQQRWPIPATDEKITVHIDGVSISGQPHAFIYDVIIIRTDQPTPGTPQAALAGPAPAKTDDLLLLRSASLPFSEGLQWRLWASTAVDWTEGAEGGLGRFSAEVSGYTPRQTTRRAAGTAAFHLVTPEFFVPQHLVLAGEYLAQPGATLNFASSLSLATANQYASVQVSRDGGGSWESVWTISGEVLNNNQFTQEAIDLSAFVGNTLRFRFRYVATGSAFINTTPEYGWAFDDVSLSGFAEVGATVATGAAPGTAFVVQAPAPGNYQAQARDILFGGFGNDWGPARDIEVLATAPPPPGAGAQGWTHDARLGDLFAAGGGWIWTRLLGWVHVAAFPAIYQPAGGWLLFITGSAETGAWLRRVDDGAWTWLGDN
jgi:hypothetical protein